MSNKVIKKFGVGLDAVLGVALKDMETLKKHVVQELKQVLVQKIIPGRFQPRRHFDEGTLIELANSIKAQGILQPIIVRKYSDTEYEIIAGERRWRAAQMTGLQQVPVIICQITNKEALAFGLIENIQREQLNPIEEAKALKRLIEEFSMTHEAVAKSIGRSRASVSNMLRLLNLAPKAQEMLIGKKLNVGHVRVLLVFSVDEQTKMAENIVRNNLTVRATEKMAQSKKSGQINLKKLVNKHKKCESWSIALSAKFFGEVNVLINEHGAGKVIINISSEKQVESMIKENN